MAATEEYHSKVQPDTARYREVTYTRVIDAAREAVPVIDLADRLAGPGKMRRVGKTFATNCLLPDHEDRTPSFVVYPETNSWYCFGCLRGGDVVKLYRLVCGFDEREAHAAAGHLLLEFGHQPPERPPSWFRKQERQKRTRDLVEEARVESMTLRLWRYVFEPIVAEIEDEHARKTLAQRLWPNIEANARHILAQRMGEAK